MTDTELSAPPQYPLLDLIDDPTDLRALPSRALRPLASELRAFLIDSVSRTGDHLAAGLGVVERTIALHRVFSPSTFRIATSMSASPSSTPSPLPRAWPARD